MRDVAIAQKTPVAADFLRAAERLVHHAGLLVAYFSASIEIAFPVPDFNKNVVAGKSIWFLRFLHYFGGQEINDETAAPHADKAGFTLHLHESDSGLELWDRKKKWHPAPLALGDIGILPGMRLQYLSECRVPAICHRVVATEKTARDGRWSLVLFVHPANTPRYDKDRRGRLQEFAPGWNYDMPFEEFRKFFVD